LHVIALQIDIVRVITDCRLIKLALASQLVGLHVPSALAYGNAVDFGALVEHVPVGHEVGGDY